MPVFALYVLYESLYGVGSEPEAPLRIRVGNDRSVGYVRGGGGNDDGGLW